MNGRSFVVGLFLPVVVLSVLAFGLAGCFVLDLAHRSHDPQAAHAHGHAATVTAAQTPSAVLGDEHQIVLAVAGEAEKEAAAIRRTGEMDRARVEKMVPFFRNFVDKCHHTKEERFYFPAAVVRNPGHIRPIITQLENEHEQGREILRGLSADLERNDARSVQRVADGLEQYAAMIRAHIQTEDRTFFPEAERAFSNQDRVTLMAAFDKIEREEMGEGFHEAYHRMAEDLAGSGR